MPPTVDGFLLLGWMEKNEAIPLLLNDCWFDPPLTNQQAEEIWQKYKASVDAMPERKPTAPKRQPIPNSVLHIVNNFRMRTRGPEVLDVINVDPRELQVYQLYVVADRADHHARQLKGDQWHNACLQIDRPNNPLPLRNDSGIVKVTLPHAEYMFAMVPGGAFQIQQGAGFISVCEVEGRIVLKAGYHRSFAFARSRMKEPEAKDKSLLVAVTKTVPPQLLADFPKQGLRTTVLGSRPPLFSDFLDAALAMPVKLRKKRYEMHIKVEVAAINET
jgi:hypothetical protein